MEAGVSCACPHCCWPHPNRRAPPSQPTADNFDNLAPLVVICTLSALLPLPLLRLLPDGVDQDGERDGGSDSDDSEDSRKAD